MTEPTLLPYICVPIMHWGRLGKGGSGGKEEAGGGSKGTGGGGGGGIGGGMGGGSGLNVEDEHDRRA